ncbi:MAG: glycosyltransferase [Candidatus Bathyarchaeia archaeon]
MAEISILLPSLRPEAVLQRVEEFKETNDGVDYEIIIVSPYSINGEKVIHIKEVELQGVISAMNLAYRHASGEYIVYWSDDASPMPNCLSNMKDFIKQNNPPFIGAFRIRDRYGRELEQWSVYGKLYACWGCLSKETINIVGGLFDSNYRSYWADPDLGMRTWIKGGKVEICPNAWLKIEHIKDNLREENFHKYFEKDTETFYERWHDGFGKNFQKLWTEINKPIPVNKLIHLEREGQDRYPLKKNKYKVSALVTTYNSEKFLRGLLEDLEGQTIADQTEIIIIDSHSLQNEKAIVEEFQKQFDNIIYFRTDKRETTHKALNRAIKLASGKFLTLACTDDRHRKDAFEQMVKILEEFPDIALVYADCAVTNVENDSFENPHIIGCYKWPDFDPRLLFRGNFIGPQPMWRRELHEKYGYFDAKMIAAGDYEFWLRMAWNEKFYHIPEVMGLYFMSPQGLENKNRKICDQETEQSRLRYWPAHLGPLPPFDSNFFVPFRHFQNFKNKKRIVAIIAAFNEEDIIYHVIGDLIHNGIEVYFIDNNSNDNTVNEVKKWLGKGVIHIEHFPEDSGFPERCKKEYVWKELLRRKEEIAAKLIAKLREQKVI